MFVNVTIGLRVSDIKPITFIEDDGAELLLLNQLNKCRNYGNHLSFRNELEDFWLDTVDSGELVGSGSFMEDISHIGDFVTRDADVTIFTR